MQDGPIIGDIVDEETTQVVIGDEDHFELEEPEPEHEPAQPEPPKSTWDASEIQDAHGI